MCLKLDNLTAAMKLCPCVLSEVYFKSRRSWWLCSPSTRHGCAWGERMHSSYSFTTSALDGGEWSASRPGRALPPGERIPGTHCTGGWVGPRAGLDTEARRKILCPCRGSNPDRTVVQPVVRHYTAWANPAPHGDYRNNIVSVTLEGVLLSEINPLYDCVMESNELLIVS
jgi:hypothetical protein